MNSANYRVRRATVDDLGALRTLWEPMGFPAPELERRLTEFQVAVGLDGEVLGALALQINGRHGRLHSEVFGDFSLAEPLRPLLWERLQSIASSHGLVRLWTQESAPFWSRCGFSAADAETLARLPAAWGGTSSNWLTVQLRDEAAVLSLDKEFAMFVEAEKQRMTDTSRYAKNLKFIATALAIVLAIFVALAAFRLLQQNPQLLGR